MGVWVDFAVQAGAGLVGVFAGVVLALFTERLRRRAEDARLAARETAQVADLRRAVLGSVVRNASEAKRVKGALGDTTDDYLFRLNIELSVWESTKQQFMQRAQLDERIAFTRFFDEVGRLHRLVDFVRQARADSVAGSVAVDRSSPPLQAMESRLTEIAEDVRLAGVILVTDHGEAMHKRLLGVTPSPAGSA